MIKDIIYQHLVSLEIDGLATYGNSKAIFEQQAPDDSDRNWGETQYGRVVYDLTMRDDPERKVAGVFNVMIAFLNDEKHDGYSNLVNAEDVIRNGCDGTFFSETDLTIASAWRRTRDFAEKIGDGNDIDVYGKILEFDIYAFPVDEISPSDPVISLSQFIKNNLNGISLINLGETDVIWKPDISTPYAYVRLSSIEPGTFPSTAACTWFNATLIVHFFAGSDSIETYLANELIRELMIHERFPMNDDSPCFVGKVTFSRRSDALKDGQLVVVGQYGILYEEDDADMIRHIYMNRRMNTVE